MRENHLKSRDCRDPSAAVSAGPPFVTDCYLSKPFVKEVTFRKIGRLTGFQITFVYVERIKRGSWPISNHICIERIKRGCSPGTTLHVSSMPTTPAFLMMMMIMIMGADEVKSENCNHDYWSRTVLKIITMIIMIIIIMIINSITWGTQRGQGDVRSFLNSPAQPLIKHSLKA